MQYQANLTPAQVAAYLANSLLCPFCQSQNIDGGENDQSGDEKNQTITCNDCNREWMDVYTLSNVESLEQCCDKCNEILQDGEKVEEGDYGGLRHVKCPRKKK